MADVFFLALLAVFGLLSAGLIALYWVLRLQQHLPLNPQGFDAASPDLAFNTAVSFATNTNWQSYGGETTLSYFSQMLGLTAPRWSSRKERRPWAWFT